VIIGAGTMTVHAPCPGAPLNGGVQPFYPEVNEVALRVEQVGDEVGHDWEILLCSLCEAFLGIGTTQIYLQLRKI
jgi:hypothetical protein